MGGQWLERAVAPGTVEAHRARIWLRSPGGGPHVFELWPADAPADKLRRPFQARCDPARDHTCVVTWPDDLRDAPPLRAATHFRFRISREDGTPVGEGGFETRPEGREGGPESFSLALASCHQPFDEDGSLRPASTSMLRACEALFARQRVRFVLWMGDQLYADYPLGFSLFEDGGFRPVAPPGRARLLDCDEAEVRAVYQRRYRWAWQQPEWQRLQADYAGYPMCDDHEVVDNWNSLEPHRTAPWRAVTRGARMAYEDYQHARIFDRAPGLEDSYHYHFEWGPLGVFVLDTRSQRNAVDGDARILGDAQLAELEAWLRSSAQLPMILVVSTVPPFFMPGWFNTAAAFSRLSQFSGDAADRWSHRQYRDERRRLLRVLEAHQERVPEQKVIVCGGDVHVGYINRVQWGRERPLRAWQFVTSPITHQMSGTQWRAAKRAPRLNFWMGTPFRERTRLHLVGGPRGRLQQPVGRLNVGILEVRHSAGRAAFNASLWGDDEEDPGQPLCLFESGWTD